MFDPRFHNKHMHLACQFKFLLRIAEEPLTNLSRVRKSEVNCASLSPKRREVAVDGAFGSSCFCFFIPTGFQPLDLGRGFRAPRKTGFAILSRSERATSEVSRLPLRIHGKNGVAERGRSGLVSGVRNANKIPQVREARPGANGCNPSGIKNSRLLALQLGHTHYG
jgi:hypothetical protein